jgi:hypothetical protein
MKKPRHNSEQNAKEGLFIVPDSSLDSTHRTRRASDSDLSVGPGVINEQTVAGLLDDWIIPSVVERLIIAAARIDKSEEK